VQALKNATSFAQNAITAEQCILFFEQKYGMIAGVTRSEYQLESRAFHLNKN
jgi:hypothetical protein